MSAISTIIQVRRIIRSFWTTGSDGKAYLVEVQQTVRFVQTAGGVIEIPDAEEIVCGDEILNTLGRGRYELPSAGVELNEDEPGGP